MRKSYFIPFTAMLLASCGGADTATTDTPADTDTASNTMAAEPAAGTDNDNSMGATEMQPTDAAGYAAKAGASDMWEIESSKALLAKSTNADLKKFAQMMVDHHTQSTAKVKAAAKTANITLAEPKLDAMQQKMLDEIKAADAKTIDAVYTGHQKTAHQAALALHQGYAANGDNEAFKKVAGEIVPVVEKHIAELGKMPM